MNNKSRCAALLALMCSLLFVSGCLKDKDYDSRVVQAVRSTGNDPRVVEIKLTAGSTDNSFALAFDKSPNDTVISLVPVNLATASAAPQDIHVTVISNPDVIAQYNKANTDTVATVDHPNPTGVITAYKLLPKFTIVNPIVTIKKDSNTAYIQIKFNPLDFIGADGKYNTYAIGFTITQVAEPGFIVSGNLQNGIVILGLKNKYDGIYQRTGFILRANDNDLTGTTGPDKISLQTIDGNSSRWVQNHLWHGGGLLAASVSNPVWTVDPTTNAVVVSSSGGAFPAGLNNFPGYNSRYDPATKTFYVKATWGGGVGVREMTDTLKYIGPR